MKDAVQAHQGPASISAATQAADMTKVLTAGVIEELRGEITFLRKLVEQSVSHDQRREELFASALKEARESAGAKQTMQSLNDAIAAAISEKVAETEITRQQLELANNRLSEQKSEAERQEARSAGLEQALDEMHRLAEDREQKHKVEMLTLRQRASDLENQLAHAEHEASASTARISMLEEALARSHRDLEARFREIERLTRRLLEEERKSQTISEDFQTLSRQLKELKTRHQMDLAKYRQRETQLREAQAKVLAKTKNDLTLLVAERDTKITDLSGQLSRCNREVAEVRQQIHAVVRSRSWRLTAPMRWRSSPPRDPSNDLTEIRSSELFDAKWYLDAYPDVAGSQMDPAEHYLRHGAAEGRNPGPDFDTDFYLNNYPDVRAAGMNPLIHFIRHGKAEGRNFK